MTLEPKCDMRQFFKFLFASMAGTLAAFLVVGIVFFLIFSVMVASVSQLGNQKPVTVESQSIYAPDFAYGITERKMKDPFEGFNFPGVSDILPLPQLLKSIERAKTDTKIEALFLDMGMVPVGRTSLLAVKEAIEDFKTSGKPVYAYGNFYSSGSYFLASAADSIFMQPTGLMEFNGMVAEMMFLRGALDKLDIEPRVIKHGRYKSAGEFLQNTKMSEANREQNTELIYSIYNHYLSEISKSRGIDTATLRNIANEYLVRNAEDAVRHGLVDRLIYRDEMLKKLAGISGKSNIEDLKLVGYKEYSSTLKGYKYNSDKVAVVYANGNIVMGDGSSDQIGSETLSKAIRKARLDDDVKAIVLRVNSPGGSALASDVILREAELAAEAKPFIVSMGDVAASGGYYISCKADKILAEPNTVTGSIGVIGVLMGTEKFFENKLGITYDRIKTGKYADLGNPNRDMSKEEEMMITHAMDEIYVDFITHVGEGRNMDTSKVNELGRGRVWTGLQALEHGLVDDLGGLDDAIKVAVEKAGLEDGKYGVLEYPEQKSALEEIFGDFGASLKERAIKEELGVHYKAFKRLKQVQQYNGPMMLMPYDFN